MQAETPEPQVVTSGWASRWRSSSGYRAARSWRTKRIAPISAAAVTAHGAGRLAEAGQVTRESMYYDAGSEQWMGLATNPELMAIVFPRSTYGSRE